MAAVELTPDPQSGYTPIDDELVGVNRIALGLEKNEGKAAEYSIPVDMTLVAELINGRYVFTELHAVGITSHTFRSIPFGRLLNGIAWSALMVKKGRKLTPVQRPGKATDGPTRDALIDAAFVYRVAATAGNAPTNEVARVLGLTRPTAGRWVMQAREAGFLPPAS